jgi:hypothetical protein
MPDVRTHEQALKDLRRCSRCLRWITLPDCDSCWVDSHTCPPTPERAIGLLKRAMEIGQEAQRIAATLKIESR